MAEQNRSLFLANAVCCCCRLVFAGCWHECAKKGRQKHISVIWFCKRGEAYRAGSGYLLGSWRKRVRSPELGAYLPVMYTGQLLVSRHLMDMISEKAVFFGS
ncbi:hypothetical protein GGS20DRAFT_530803 [Poronia punctata]|nr:hypothetical protein GGS20DRAFT_530803 [Poronia punctata]